jgi:protein-ribulosamine 3-kinase
MRGPWDAVAASIAQATGRAFDVQEALESGGGSINRAVRLSDGARSFFVKLNRAGLSPMFEAEAQGLEALAASAAIRVPLPVCVGESEQASWLVLEHLDLAGRTPDRMAEMGRRIAALHAVHGARFGWHRDNTIGSTAQANGWSGCWATFWRERRLAPQLGLAAAHGYTGALQRQGEALLSRLPQLLSGRDARPNLLHGDLWRGNASFTSAGEPVVYDPACYFGDREADLAMTELFGGFPRAFYAAYEEVLPRAEGYALRRDLYNLYHVLNHLNLFGAAYLEQARGLIGRLLSEVK